MKVPDTPSSPDALPAESAGPASKRVSLAVSPLALALVVSLGCAGETEAPPDPDGPGGAPTGAAAAVSSGPVADEPATTTPGDAEAQGRAAEKPALLPVRGEGEASPGGEGPVRASSREVESAPESAGPAPARSERVAAAGGEGSGPGGGPDPVGDTLRVTELRPETETDRGEPGVDRSDTGTRSYAGGGDGPEGSGEEEADAGSPYAETRGAGDRAPGDAWRAADGADSFELAVPAGTRMVLTLRTPLSTRESREGDTFHAVTTDDILGVEGVVLVPRGAKVLGRVTASRKSPGAEEPALLSLAVEEVVVDGVPRALRATIVEIEAEAGSRDGGRETATKIGVGAAAGALLGKILGGDSRDALRGAIAGAAAGTVVALTTADGHASIGQGARMVIRLDEPLVVEAP